MTTVGPQSTSADSLISREAFESMARRLAVDRDVWDELFPMVRDLLGFADKLKSFAPDLGEDMELMPRQHIEGENQ